MKKLNTLLNSAVKKRKKKRKINQASQRNKRRIAFSNKSTSSSLKRRTRKKIKISFTNKQQILKSSLKQRFKASYRYYKKKLDAHIAITLSKVDDANIIEKMRIKEHIEQLFNIVQFVMENNLENEEYLECIRKKFRMFMVFFAKLKAYDYSLGRYIRKEGFNELVPEEIVVDHSPKMSDVLENMQKELDKCQKYTYKDQ